MSQLLSWGFHAKNRMQACAKPYQGLLVIIMPKGMTKLVLIHFDLYLELYSVRLVLYSIESIVKRDSSQLL